MPFLNTLRRALPAAILLATIATAQQCYFPDGETLATSDTPCDSTATNSACCPSDSFCLSGGLCISGGVISRGSCTDQTWGTAACAGFCKTVSTSSEVAITPCSTDTDSNTFACGLAGDCSADTFQLPSDTSLALRPAQIAALVGTLQSNSPEPSAAAADEDEGGDGGVSVGALIGVAVGIGLPLLIALIVALVLLRREKRRFSKPKLMYNLPEEVKEEEDFSYRSPPPIHPAVRPESTAETASAYSSRRGSIRTATAVGSPAFAPSPRAPTGTFMDRYESLKKNASGPASDPASMHELESTPPYKETERHEMGDYRRSQSSMTMR